MTDNLHVEPSALDKASAGINGVIDGLADTARAKDAALQERLRG